ncbi:response regulator [Herbaspirillum robiniae]|uniref:response regulator n=1 Tax=Herbaspirillum robiniae TaxID=2014887 RepID=UPI003D772396
MDTSRRADKTILVVDDADDLRAIYVAGLVMVGYKVVAAESGVAALAQLGQKKVDAILTDLWMPRMTGAAMASAIRADARHQHIPITLVSAVPPETVDWSLFECVLRKPCSLEDVIETVDLMCFSAD